MIPDERFSDIVKLHDGHPDSESHAEPFRPPDEFVSISDVDFILLMLMLLPEKYGKQSKTRVRKVEKCIPKILNGMGLQD
jgi:hypothetical protein